MSNTTSSAAPPEATAEELIERLKPRHTADEPIAMAVISPDQKVRREAVMAYLVANNALKSEAAAALSTALRDLDGVRAELEQRDVEIAFLLGDGNEIAEEAGASRDEESAFIFSEILRKLRERLAARAARLDGKGGTT